MGAEKIAALVNTFGMSLISVSKEMGVQLSLVKSEVAQGVNTSGSCCAALVGVVGGGLQGTIVVMLDEPGFGAVVTAMSGGRLARHGFQTVWRASAVPPEPNSAAALNVPNRK